VSGFAGGKTANPTYKQVTKGGTGHYEAVQITYDDARLPLPQLFDMFFRSVDPTDAGGQFCDRGSSYRFGLVSKAKAYKKYRDACGRDQRVKQLWGSSAPFAS